MVDLMDVSNEIQETLGRSFKVADDIDEEDLWGVWLLFASRLFLDNSNATYGHLKDTEVTSSLTVVASSEPILYRNFIVEFEPANSPVYTSLRYHLKNFVGIFVKLQWGFPHVCVNLQASHFSVFLFSFSVLQNAELDALEADMDFYSNLVPLYLQLDNETDLDSELNLPAAPSGHILANWQQGKDYIFQDTMLQRKDKNIILLSYNPL
ncbi:hypothetical protein TRIUR3_18910 [Triticum urartu]|uniref:Uncharacterized protein n=1 Tax=Triticum urartu TaxID=4572 RepID=M8AR13_TRIUA|nr:hypothetical protein TRIUR3_18910 [Triticum urartu]